MKFGQTSIAVLIAIVFVAMFNNTGFAAGVNWGNDLKKAAVESRQSGKPILITFTASWCHYCHKLLDETFSNPQVIARVNEYFVPVVLDADQNERAVQLLGIEAFPSTIIISPELNILGKIKGFHRAPQMVQQLTPFCRSTPPLQQAVVSKSPPKPVAQPVAAQKPAPETAFSGMCLVSMLDDRDLVRGKSEITDEYRGVKLHFASEQHQQAFRAAPEKYWPMTDGHCPVASVRGETQTRGAASTAAVYRGKIVLFRSMKHRNTFADNPRHFADTLARMQSASR